LGCVRLGRAEGGVAPAAAELIAALGLERAANPCGLGAELDDSGEPVGRHGPRRGQLGAGDGAVGDDATSSETVGLCLAQIVDLQLRAVGVEEPVVGAALAQVCLGLVVPAVVQVQLEAPGALHLRGERVVLHVDRGTTHFTPSLA